MASSVISPLHPLPGNSALLPPPSCSQPPSSAFRLLLPRHPSPPSVSARSIAARRRLSPVVRSGWRGSSVLSDSLLTEFIENNAKDWGDGSSVSPSAAESLAVAYPALANTYALWHKSRCYNFQVTVMEDEPEEELFWRLRKEALNSGVIRESRRRRFFEDKQAKKKRKAREAARRNKWMSSAHDDYYYRRYAVPNQGSQSQGGGAKKSKKRRRPARFRWPDLQEVSKKEESDGEDNWELPDVEIPYCK